MQGYRLFNFRTLYLLYTVSADYLFVVVIVGIYITCRSSTGTESVRSWPIRSISRSTILWRRQERPRSEVTRMESYWSSYSLWFVPALERDKVSLSYSMICVDKLCDYWSKWLCCCCCYESIDEGVLRGRREWQREERRDRRERGKKCKKRPSLSLAECDIHADHSYILFNYLYSSLMYCILLVPYR